MDSPAIRELEKLPRKSLIDLIKMYSRNWVTVDGLWFSGVEEKYGIDAAMELDVRMWQIGSKTEARRIKKLFNMDEGGIANIIKTIDFMSWAFCFGYEYDVTDERAVWTCKRCLPQEQRIKLGKGEFPCKPTFEALFSNVIDIIDPRVKYQCLFCPPDPHPQDECCKWELTLPGDK